ncbi:MAG: aminotransferase class III-fold pyridoxal phosphate-dependent enzyme [Pseudomonadota bacterium]
MHKTSIFNIKIDFDKSYDSYLYDKNRQKHFLDFFGLYSSLPLGYNHPIFKDETFLNSYNKLAGIKVTNCEIISDEAESFFLQFSKQDEMKIFKHFHFCCTGALAIEASIKTAIDHKCSSTPVVISLLESFHGINSYGGFLTDRFFPVSERLKGMPTMKWHKIHNPKIIYKNGEKDNELTKSGLEQFEAEFNTIIDNYGKENVAALLVEPIQATYGDNYFPKAFFKLIRSLCDKFNICLIFDEIQTGFGSTGKLWYYQFLDIEPDIVAFGKKTQVSGIMVKENFSKIFQKPIRLEVTWDGDLIDMLRCQYILKAYKKYNILKNVNERSEELLSALKQIDALQNVRRQGLMFAFDFICSKEQEHFVSKAFENGLLFNRTRDKTIRFRPNLNVSSEEIQEAVNIIRKIY